MHEQVPEALADSGQLQGMAKSHHCHQLFKSYISPTMAEE